MADVPAAANEEPARPVRSAPRKDAAKKQAALWKRQLKLLKAKDADKKREGLAFCEQTPQFFREQPEVLPALLALLTRLKTPDIVLDALTVFEALLFPTSTGAQPELLPVDDEASSESGKEAALEEEARANAQYMIQCSLTPDAGNKGGQPFVGLLTAAAASPEIKAKAVKIYGRLLDVVVTEATAEPTDFPRQGLLSFQTAGLPVAALLSCLESGDSNLQFAALSCLQRLLASDCDGRVLAEFSSKEGYPLVLRFGQHVERRFHLLVLGILDTLSRTAAERDHLMTHGTLKALDQMLKEAVDALEAAAAAIQASGPSASTLTPEAATAIGTGILLMCQVFARIQVGTRVLNNNEQLAVPSDVEPSSGCLSFLDSMLAVLRKDFGAAMATLTASTTPSPPAVTGNAAAVAAAAAAAAASAAAVAALFPFTSDRPVVMLSCLGRMIERNERCKAHAYSRQVIGVALDWFKLPNQGNLHQVADKLLHQCCTDGRWSGDSPRSQTTVKTVFQPLEAPPLDEEATESTTTNAGVPVETVVALLEPLVSTGSEAAVFRLVRWLALLVAVPDNARALGEHCTSVLLKILARSRPQQHLLVGLLAKLVGAIVEATPRALEGYSQEGLDPVPRLVAYLLQASPQDQTTDQDELRDDMSETVDRFDDLLLEWVDENDEPGLFQPMALTEERHAIDPFIHASHALLAIVQSFEAACTADTAAVSDFWDQYSQREAPLGGQQSKPSPAIGTSAAAPSKKRLDTPGIGPTGETTVLSILRSSHELLGLVPTFAGTSPEVCVALLSLTRKLLGLRGGTRVLLELERSRMNSLSPQIDEEDATTSQSSTLTASQPLSWPIDAESCSQSAHASVLRPLMAVLHSFSTSFDEVQAAVQVISLLTMDNDIDGGKQDESSPSVTDWFVSCAVVSGALGTLVAYLDSARIPTAPLRASSSTDRLEEFTAQVKTLVMQFCNWGRQKQQASTTNSDAEEQRSTPVETASQPTAGDSKTSTFETLWAQQMLDLRVDVPRFGYSNYSALLLAAEIGQTDTAIALLNAGASASTTSTAGTTLLMLSTLNRDEVLINELVRHGADLNAVTTDGRDQTLWLCAMVSSSEAHGLISDTYAAASTSTSDSNADALPLLMALDTIRGSPVALNGFMQHGMDTNVSDANGNFPLHAALSKAHVQQKLRGIDLCFRYDSRLVGVESLTTLVTELMEEFGADVHKANHLGQTPLHLALLYGHSSAVRLLLQHGANPNVLDTHGYLPFHYACCGFCGASDGSDSTAVDLIQLLLDAAPKYPIIQGKHVDDRKFKTSAEKKAIEIEQHLQQGLLSITQPYGIVTELATVDKVVHTASTTDGFLPWHMTCGAFTHSPSTLPLDDAMANRFASNGGTRCAILTYLMAKCGVEVGQPALKGVTALHLAIKSSTSGCNDGVIEILLTNGQAADKPKRIDINAVHDAATIDSLPPLVVGSEVTVVGVDPADIHGFVSSRSALNPSEYHILLANGVHVESVDRQRLRLADSTSFCNKVSKRYFLFVESCFTALHYALQTSDELSRRLLAVPELSLKAEGIDIPFLALACAAHRSADVVKPLIGPSANVRVKLPLITSSVNFRTGSSSSAGSRKKHAAALHYAVMYEDVAVTRELVASSHINVNVRRSGDGFSPLHLACEIGNLEIVKLLIDHGADVGQESAAAHHDSVTPLLQLVKSGAFADVSVRKLVLEKCHDPHVLFGDFAGPVEDTERSSSKDNGGMSEAPDATCCLVTLEYQNLSLYDRIQQLKAQHRVPSELLARKLEIDLAKLDGVLNDFFELLQSDEMAMQSSQIFARLPHPHECFRCYKVRSAWTEGPEDESN